MEHRAGWDATFSAPKSVSLTALVGGDERVREAHRESVCVALDELERYVQARIGGNLPAETTGKWVAAKFEHDSARPVDGYAAPQLHTHVVFFNLTETDDGETHALQPRELYKTQQYATAVYRSELAHRLKELGYEIERGDSSQPESKATARSIWRHRVRAASRSRNISQRRTSEEQARHRSRRTRREKQSSNSHTKRCSSDTKKWPPSSAINQSGLLKRHGSKESVYRKNPKRKPSGRPWPTRERKIWSVKPWPRSASCYGMRLSVQWVTPRLQRLKRSSTNACKRASSSRRAIARRAAHSPPLR